MGRGGGVNIWLRKIVGGGEISTRLLQMLHDVSIRTHILLSMLIVTTMGNPKKSRVEKDSARTLRVKASGFPSKEKFIPMLSYHLDLESRGPNYIALEFIISELSLAQTHTHTESF